MADQRHVDAVKQGRHRVIELLQEEKLDVLDVTGADFRKRTLEKVKFDGWDLSGCDFSNSQLKQCTFVGSTLEGAVFENAALSDADFSHASLIGTNFQGCRADMPKFVEATLIGVNMGRINFRGATFTKARIDKATGDNYSHFDGAVFSEAQVSNSVLSQVDMGTANCENAVFENTDLSGAIFDPRARLINTTFGNQCILERASIAGASLSNCNFHNCNLNRILAQGTHFNHVDFGKSTLVKAELERAKFDECSLANCNLERAKLEETKFKATDFEGSNFKEASINATEFHHIRNAHRALGIDATFINENSLHFETSEVSRFLALTSWESIRRVGRLPLFGVSYVAFFGIPIIVFGLVHYNQLIVTLRDWADLVESTKSSDVRSLAVSVKSNLSPSGISAFWFCSWIASVLLGFAATSYQIVCPSRIQESSRDRWVDEHKNDLLHYLPKSWNKRRWAISCAFAYAFGGIITAILLLNRLWTSLIYIWNNVTFS